MAVEALATAEESASTPSVALEEDDDLLPPQSDASPPSLTSPPPPPPPPSQQLHYQQSPQQPTHTSSACLACFNPSASQRDPPNNLHTRLYHLSSLSQSRHGNFSLKPDPSRTRSSPSSPTYQLPPDDHNLLHDGAEPAPAEHLIIMVNGIVGNASNWKFAADQFKLKLGNEVVVHCSLCNSAITTFDGVDVMGKRLAKEVKEVIETLPGVKKISFLAHSLGGLVARYCIGQLYSRSSATACIPQGLDGGQLETAKSFLDHLQGTIAGLQPINFITVATPHIGSRGNRQLPFLLGLSLLEKVAISSAHWFVGRTGRHLFLTDKDESQLPLLQRMVTDCSEGHFISALRAFRRRVAYANVNYDHLVGWRTASIRRECELPEIKTVPVNETYPHVVRVEDLPPESDDTRTNNVPALDPVEEEMIVGLRQVSWQRVDVNFVGSRQRWAAHSTIQVKYYWIHSEGADVIAHIIDNFEA